jgi:hypothetical protein
LHLIILEELHSLEEAEDLDMELGQEAQAGADTAHKITLTLNLEQMV